MKDQKENEIVQVGSRYMSFSLAGCGYAVPLLNVKEVIAIPAVTKLANSPDYFLGITNLRGQVIPIFDLGKKLNVAEGEGKEKSVIIYEVGTFFVGVIVDSIDFVFSPTKENISPRPMLSEIQCSEAIAGIYRREKELVVFFDLAKVFSDQDMELAHSAGSEKAAA